MLIYLDLCALQRPLDDRAQLRVRLEAEAVLAVLAHCRAGGAGLCSSDVLAFEAGHNPHPSRRAYAHAALAGAVARQALIPAVASRAAALVAAGLDTLDALHLAAAEVAGADLFCTCDDRLLKRSRVLSAPPMRAVSPLELATELGL